MRSPSTRTAPSSIGGPSIVTTVFARIIIRFSLLCGTRSPASCTLPGKVTGSLSRRSPFGHAPDQISPPAILSKEQSPWHHASRESFANIHLQIGRSCQPLRRPVPLKSSPQFDRFLIVDPVSHAAALCEDAFASTRKASPICRDRNSPARAPTRKDRQLR